MSSRDFDEISSRFRAGFEQRFRASEKRYETNAFLTFLISRRFRAAFEHRIQALLPVSGPIPKAARPPRLANVADVCDFPCGIVEIIEMSLKSLIQSSRVIP